MSRENQSFDEWGCVWDYLKNLGHDRSAWEIQSNPNQSDSVDVWLRDIVSGQRTGIQVTKYHVEKTPGINDKDMANLPQLIRLLSVLAVSRIEEKQNHYGIKNTLELVLLLECSRDLPANLCKGLEERLRRKRFAGFGEIYIVCPAHNIRVK